MGSVKEPVVNRSPAATPMPRSERPLTVSTSMSTGVAKVFARKLMDWLAAVDPRIDWQRSEVDMPPIVEAIGDHIRAADAVIGKQIAGRGLAAAQTWRIATTRELKSGVKYELRLDNVSPTGKMQ